MYATFSYEEEGNLIQKVEKKGGATWQYEYYGNGMLAKVIKPDHTAVTFKYDALGRRVEKCSSEKTTTFIWDGNTIFHEYFLVDYSEKSENLSGNSLQSNSERPANLITWVFNDGFVPSAKLTNEGNYSIISDYLGTPVEAYDEQGQKVWSAELDIYGRVDEFTGEQDFIPFRYQGQYEDVEIGLYYNRFRYYDPTQGNYTQVDPIGLAGGNPTLYGYVGDPCTIVDQFGLLNEFEIARYGSKLHANDGYTAHELLQNAWLKHNKGVERLKGPISRHNPAIALTETPLHQTITKLQSKYGMHNKEVLQNQTALQNINRNAALTRRGIMEELVRRQKMSKKNAKAFATERVRKLRDEAIEHGIKHKLIPCK